MRAARREGDTSPGDHVLDRSGYQDLVGTSRGHDTRGHMYGDAADAVSTDFNLTQMQPGADLEVEPSDTVAERSGAGDGPWRPVERCEHPVPGPIHDPPPEPDDLALGHVIVPIEEPAPLLVAKPRGKARGS